MTTPLPALLEGGELDGRRGGPFSPVDVEAACAAVRGECGWHIAPQVARTVLVSGSPWTRLLLPSRRVVDVHAIREVRSGRVLTGWRRGVDAVLVRDNGWPIGIDNLEVDLTDGHDQCPPDLTAVVLERVRVLAAARLPGTQSATRTVDGVTRSSSVTDSSAARTPAWTLAAEAVLDRFRVR